ncbi:BA75_01448T0 [Komagataella pastoris]|uniref:BA75_01448T0 n=1 Tax=Komagataella pastoris TaxID=4922 RepID=A0A1B2J9E7_PICPA|nr:BA75_01448T0 [Komagataella pastoris]
MFRILANSSTKQGQRVSSKLVQHNSPSGRLFNTQSPASASKNANTSASTILHDEEPPRPLRDFNQKKNKKNFRPYFQVQTPEDSAFKNELLAFDNYSSQNTTYDLSSESVTYVSPTFWDAIIGIMPIYRQLLESGELTSSRVQNLVSFLRNGLRMNRLELKKLKNKPDFDSSSKNNQMYEFLLSSVREVSNDLLDEKFSPNVSLTSLLIDCFRDMQLPEEAISFWSNGKQIPNLTEIFEGQMVLGAVLPILADAHEANFDELYPKYLELQKNVTAEHKVLHPKFLLGMIRVCLSNNKVDESLQIFKSLVNNLYQNNDGKTPLPHQKSNVTMAHLSFVGYCKNIDTADVFFNDAMDNKLPYHTPLQLNFINSYMNNTWEVTRDFERVKTIWIKTWNNYASKKYLPRMISSSFNNVFFNIFFQKYPQYSAESIKELKQLIVSYSQIRPLDEPFLNVLTSKCQQWRSLEVIDSIQEAYQTYNIEPTLVAHRCLLKALGSVDVPPQRIQQTFENLLLLHDANREAFLAPADLTSLKSATIRSPILDELSGGRDERVKLFFQLFKVYGPYLKSTKALDRWIASDIEQDPSLAVWYKSLGSLDVSKVNRLNLPRMKRNEQFRV